MEIEAARLIEEEAQSRLGQSPYPDLQKITVTFRHGILTLYGVVQDFHIRRKAQEIIEDLEGIEIIDNQLAVANDPRPPPNRIRAFTSNGDGTNGSQEPDLWKIQGNGRAEPAAERASSDEI